MRDVIELRGLRCNAIVGVLAEERDRTQPLSFDIDIERPFERAARDDDVRATTNYAEVAAIAITVARDGAFFLLETLARRVAHAVLAMDDEIESVSVSVRKLRPPLEHDVATVGVRCTVRSR